MPESIHRLVCQRHMTLIALHQKVGSDRGRKAALERMEKERMMRTTSLLVGRMETLRQHRGAVRSVR